MGKKKKKKWKKLVEIKTNKKGWHVVELLKILKGGKVLLKLSSGETIRRHTRKLRWHINKKYIN